MYPVYDVVERKLDSKLAREKEKIINLIEVGLGVLDIDKEVEQPLIEAKDLRDNVERYNSSSFPYSPSQYYRVEKRALEKLEDRV
ncbi:hypothetical protein [Halonatronum saccharophilum]|uniref:hypothetical protein n=1 Tax=Halonatronum saccharophilum TaxID=150060 RepID=UPI000483950B|nr:hypothetical protein [Halonatronum saccharophilum]